LKVEVENADLDSKHSYPADIADKQSELLTKLLGNIIEKTMPKFKLSRYFPCLGF
jgi:hypothetical protein